MPAFEMYPTIITPYLPNESIDYDALGKLIRLYAEVGCEGIFAVCQSSEMFFLSEAEKLELAARSIAFCREFGIKCVVSGHTQKRADDRIRYLRQLEALSPDAIVLVSNRLAEPEEDDDTAIRRLAVLMDALKPETRLGIYECPYPYKRLLSEKMIRFMKDCGRFDFIKDTCCRFDLIRERLDLLKGSGVRLFNANMATLLESVYAGAAGYSGILLNLLPDHFTCLRQALISGEKEKARRIGDFLVCAGTIEYQNYPRNAKFLLTRKGLLQCDLSRTPGQSLTESQQKEMLAFAAFAEAVKAGFEG